MIELHAWPTPNGFKISIMLEEVGLPYEVRPIDIGKGDQFDPEFLRISPNNKTKEETLETIRLLGEHVIPKLDTDPVHRSSRMRDRAALATAR